MIIVTPDFEIAKQMQATAPPGIIARPGVQTAVSNEPAILLVGIKEPNPTQETKDLFVEWLIRETSKDDRCTVNFRGETIGKHKDAIEPVFDLMVKSRNELRTD